MKKLILAALSLCLTGPVYGSGPKVSSLDAKALLVKLRSEALEKKQKLRLMSEPLVRITVSPELPKQGEKVTIFAQPSTGFVDSELVLEGKLDGAAVGMEHPAEKLWIHNAGAFTEIKTHTFSAKLYIQDRAQAQQIRDAIVALEAQVTDLEAQIAAATDPSEIAQLTAQRDEKVALKNQMVAALADLKTAVGEQTQEFSIVRKGSGSVFPRITNVSPTLVKTAGGSTITITGANFGPSPQVLIDGIASAVTTSNSTSITLNTPAFSVDGVKDVELRFTSGGVIKNAIRKNALFATSDVILVPTIPDTAPVGVALAVASSISIGTTAQVTAASSYDLNSQPLAYEWRLISKPSASGLPINSTPVSTNVTYSFLPDFPGHYVMELRVAETTAPFMAGNVSLAVVEVTAPANTAPAGSAPSMLLKVNTTASSQVTSSDADTWQSRSYFVSKQSAYGTATVSSTGLVSFSAGAAAGTDSIEVLMIDNGTPPLSSTVSIPVSVVTNFPPVFGSPVLARQKTKGIPYQARLSQTIGVNGVTDPDGTIQSVVWNFGDGTSEATLDRNSNFIFHNYMATGTYTVTVTATDNLGATASQSATLNITDTDIPTSKFRASPLTGTFPLTVNFDGSESSDSEGIASYRWIWPGTALEEINTVPTASRTFSAPGTYSVRFRTIDVNGAEGEATVPITVGESSGSIPPISLPEPFPRMVTVNTPMNFTGARSFAPTVGASLTNYNWAMNDFVACPTNGCNLNALSHDWTFQAQSVNFVGLQVTSSLGALSSRTFMETIVTNGSLPPRAVARAASFTGVAPFTLNVNASESYSYPGGNPIASYLAFWGEGSPTSTTSPTFSHTYNTPGVYQLTLNVIDSVGNRGAFPQTVIVTSSLAELNAQKKLDEIPADPEREYQRQMAAGACGAGDASACYELGVMYGQDGNEFVKTKLWEKACDMGYTQACSRK